MPKALVTSAPVGRESIDQPTTRRLKVSSTTAQYTLPSRVGRSVMSVTHTRSGRGLWTSPGIAQGRSVVVWGCSLRPGWWRWECCCGPIRGWRYAGSGAVRGCAASAPVPLRCQVLD